MSFSLLTSVTWISRPRHWMLIFLMNSYTEQRVFVTFCVAKEILCADTLWFVCLNLFRTAQIQMKYFLETKSFSSYIFYLPVFPTTCKMSCGGRQSLTFSWIYSRLAFTNRVIEILTLIFSNLSKAWATPFPSI